MGFRALVIAGLAATVLAGAGGEAVAGAWTRPKGEGQVIVSGSVGVAPQSPFGRDTGDTQSSFTSLFLEYGVLDGLTVGGTAYVEIPEESGADNTASVGLLVRKRLWQRDAGDVASVQLGYVTPLDDVMGARFGGDGADPTEEVSLRGLYGRGFWGDWGNAFVSLEGGYHLQLDGDDDEVRADATAGYAASDCCLTMVSVYSTFPLGDDDDRAVKIAPSFAYTFAAPERGEEENEPRGFSFRPFTLQIAVSQDLLNFDDGLGVQLSLWKSF